MATITEQSERSELVLRYSRGALVSREQWNRIRTLVDGVEDEKRERGEGPIELGAEDLASALSDVSAGLTIQVEALQADKVALTAERDGVAGDKAALESQLAAMTAARDRAIADKDAAATAATEAASAVAATHAAAVDALNATHATAVTALQAQLAVKDATITARDATIEALQHPPAPQDPVVTALQARIAMKQAGVLTLVLAHMAALPEDDEVRIYWEYATELHRSNPILKGVATALGLSDTQLDGLFAAAQQIQ